MDWLSIVIVSGVFLFFTAIMYKALREPVDLVLSWLKAGWDRIVDSGPTTKMVETIRYD